LPCPARGVTPPQVAAHATALEGHLGRKPLAHLPVKLVTRQPHTQPVAAARARPQKTFQGIRRRLSVARLTVVVGREVPHILNQHPLRAGAAAGMRLHREQQARQVHDPSPLAMTCGVPGRSCVFSVVSITVALHSTAATIRNVFAVIYSTVATIPIVFFVLLFRCWAVRVHFLLGGGFCARIATLQDGRRGHPPGPSAPCAAAGGGSGIIHDSRDQSWLPIPTVRRRVTAPIKPRVRWAATSPTIHQCHRVAAAPTFLRSQAILSRAWQRTTA